MTFSLDYQKSLNSCVLDVHRRAGTHTDPHVSLALLDRFYIYSSERFEGSTCHLNLFPLWLFLVFVFSVFPLLQLCDFLEQHFLLDSHDTIKKLGDYVGSLNRITASEKHGSMGEYLFDKHTL